MAFSTVYSAALNGLEVRLVEVEADISNGLPVFQMVGYLSSEVKESTLRVRAAIRNLKVTIPAKRIVVNLSPATIRKHGPSFDLPIAVALLTSLGEIDKRHVDDTLFVGELSLDGKIRGVSGVLSIVIHAKEKGLKKCIIPMDNYTEGKMIKGIEVIGVSSIQSLRRYLDTGQKEEASAPPCKSVKNTARYDFADIYSQERVKRSIEIAVSGGHNILMTGPPGSGKTMVAKRIPSIFPQLGEKESLEITKIYSINGLLSPNNPQIKERPFREVHHTISKPALLGGGMYPKPGEITMAHEGVLFLDEITEFKRDVLEVLRQPMEEGEIILSRSHNRYIFPANFILVAACNPCPCGEYPDMNKCSCTPNEIRKYLGKLSSPFLDRIDLCMEISKIPYNDLNSGNKEENSDTIRDRVEKVRNAQKARFKNLEISTNGQMNVKHIKKYCSLDKESEDIMRTAYEKMGMTARSYHKVLKVARTVADMAGSENISSLHLKEAIGYRMISR